MVRTLVASPFGQVREELRQRLEDAVGVRVVGEAASTADLARLAALRPEAIVIDLDGFDITALVAAAGENDLPVVALGEVSPDWMASRGLPGWGILSREADGSEVAAAVRAAAAGLVVMDRSMAGIAEPPAPVADQETLSGREREVLQLIAEGLPNKQIALRLGISPHTAKFHVAGVLQKLGAASRTEAVSTGVRRGFVTL